MANILEEQNATIEARIDNKVDMYSISPQDVGLSMRESLSLAALVSLADINKTYPSSFIVKNVTNSLFISINAEGTSVNGDTSVSANWKLISSGGGQSVYDVGVVTSFGDDYVSDNPNIVAYSTGDILLVQPDTTNSGPSTYKNGLLAELPLKKFDGSSIVDLSTGDFNSANTYPIIFKSTYFLIIGGGSGSGAMFPLEDRVAALPAGQTLGHYTNGESIPFSTCTTLQEVLDLLCISTLYPSLVNPFIQSISLAGGGYQSTVEVGTTITNFIASVTFNRGSITPLYPEVPVTNPPAGFRSGNITNYAFSNKITSPTNLGNVSPSQSIVVTAGTNQVDVLVSFAEGPQPRNSVGGITDASNNNYTPYPAGSIGGSASFQGKYRVFYGPSSIDHVTATPGVSAGARALTSFLVTGGEFLLNPGLTLTEFYVYVPVSSGLSMVSAITTNFENISPSVVVGPGHYILISSTFEIPNADGNTMVLYKKYKMYNDIPYTDAGLRHKIVLG